MMISRISIKSTALMKVSCSVADNLALVQIAFTFRTNGSESCRVL
jgi:hypothetical protein